MRIISWNVNGLRACTKKGFLKFLKKSGADVVCLQEVRAFPAQLDDNVRSPKGWYASFSPAERPGYSGVGIYSLVEPDRIDTSLGDKQFDIEGRFMMAHFGRTAIASVYFPKGNGKDRDNSRVPYKLDFYVAVKRKIDKTRRRGPVFIVGDYNTAHQEIDLARPRTNQKSSGFLPEERQVMTDWLADGWVDVFRKQHPGEAGHYSWWRQWGNARADNVGWRIDYILGSPSAAKRVTQSYILREITGSDHCPVGVDWE
ncbi:MAG: exodeoxyribonuclease III [Pseudomonadales bacterium]|jgi:exodeoxyribonuclease-3|nr:exodeoxyribonuclease III [Gammaproteobacteria bacterium]MDP6026034.1 exodeoxyribonuclease III [Pseudomonadales bacterium]MDP6316988.1 exodeoxyribonuclease III [Pseudomonadales bacterium]MDP7313911.1 exodeoxyribonuclease III [Pseudomonadales bacterium]MDP7576693.1 exodeoxyribonuclease III [Pseudomonadales bacterium]|tara:strand:+ start:1903 stop:2673 length:771 start_codon:yes stop_codon:yes gene_type:complete